ncbi:MAG: hypothetical protein ABIG93_03525 [archaeon]
MVLAAGLGLAGMLGCDMSQTSQSSQQTSIKKLPSEEIELSTLDLRLEQMARLNPNHNGLDTWKRVAENESTVDSYQARTGLPFSLISSHLETETKFNPYLVSTADARGDVQVMEIAFLETMYTVLGVPGGFNSAGLSKVSYLDQELLAQKDRYNILHQEAFADLDDDTYLEIQEMFENSGFSICDYLQNKQARIDEYTTLSSQYDELRNDGEKGEWTHRKEIREILAKRRKLLRAQETDNQKLRKNLKKFWDDEIAIKGTPVKNRSGRTLWYEIDPSKAPEGFVANLNLISALNFMREYRQALDEEMPLIGPVDFEAPSVERAILSYNPTYDYLHAIEGNYDTIHIFVGESKD